ncbi:MAG TPA: choice-of-anchor tandem repeat GloVer-containing protein [Candidatus Binatia bacterium]|nr:choice-of-anchor tandem repeat GloVer-containing protein [Candidatus Binatia bacterium]
MLYRFSGGPDGAYPQHGDLTFDQAGNIYGTTSNGGQPSCDCGVVFELSRSGAGWTESVLYTPGSPPYSGVIFDGTGNLYGTTLNYVYELTPTQSGWTQTTLHTFGGQGDGALAYGGLVFDQQGNVYGTTETNSSNNGGTVYELQQSGGNWTETVLRSVAIGPTDTPTMDASGDLYATLGGLNGPNFGAVFKLTPGGNGWTFTDLFDFTGAPFTDGFSPVGGVVLDSAGNLYGTTFEGGDENCGEGCGVVWEITP